MKLPTLLAHIAVKNNKGAFYFKDVVCYGNPHIGPWVEKFSCGKIRKYEYKEVPVSGYSSVAKIAAKKKHTVSHILESRANKMIDKIISNSTITFS